MVEIRFDRIIDAVASGRVGAGVIIHESRFTYREKGLVCLQDLGQWWEQASGLPIPLGCIAARRSLGEATITTVSNAIRASVEYAFAHSAQCLPYIRRHSQELEPAVVQSHIDLYVNDFSKDLGIEGLAAITAFLQRGRETGALPACDQAIFIP
jgi:1,4-dihydroxy-6-naphthoate synthase